MNRRTKRGKEKCFARIFLRVVRIFLKTSIQILKVKGKNIFY